MAAQTKEWKNKAIRKAEIISDTFEVFKIWLGHIANWVLFGCLIFNIIQTVASINSAVAGSVLIIQCVMLDVAGTSLYSMSKHAKSQGNEEGARLALIMSIILLSVMTVTALSATANVLLPQFSYWIQVIDHVLVFIRIAIVVAYGFVVHQITTLTEMHDNQIEELEQEVERLQAQVETEQQQTSGISQQLNSQQHRASTLQRQLEDAQQEVSNLKQSVSNLTVQLENEQARVSNLTESLENGQQHVSNLTVQSQKEVSNLRVKLSNVEAEVSNLTVQLESKESQLTSLKQTMDRGIKWHESNTQEVMSSVQSQLENERAKVSSLQKELSNLRVQSQGEVSNLRVQSQGEVSNLRTQLENEQARVSNLQLELSNLTVQSQAEVSNLHESLENGQQHVSNLITQLDREKQKVSALQERLNHVQKKGTEEQERVIQLDTSRTRRNRQDTEEKAMIEDIRKALKTEPGLSAQTIAARVGCSPTTASKWKKLIENERKEA